MTEGLFVRLGTSSPGVRIRLAHTAERAPAQSGRDLAAEIGPGAVNVSALGG